MPNWKHTGVEACQTKIGPLEVFVSAFGQYWVVSTIPSLFTKRILTPYGSDIETVKREAELLIKEFAEGILGDEKRCDAIELLEHITEFSHKYGADCPVDATNPLRDYLKEIIGEQ